MTPTEKVREAILSGVTTVERIASKTGLRQGTVQLILEDLELSGGLVRESLSSCPSSGCGSCGQSTGCSGAQGSRGPVLLKLTQADSKRHS
ncbi:hypothetical protein CKALI_08920 [Corynebacterium kalinowskii]|uniref:Transcriptional regulator HTH-type FeoC domain-containing protein n=1 Tax=Corynebacterium kalinowskii TaxID=2675216 RepID=A0A6B8VZ85_9CORY|nr:hypothetical protein CKALI_08920 [Corynebacterium kalinowskii]